MPIRTICNNYRLFSFSCLWHWLRVNPRCFLNNSQYDLNILTILPIRLMRSYSYSFFKQGAVGGSAPDPLSLFWKIPWPFRLNQLSAIHMSFHALLTHGGGSFESPLIFWISHFLTNDRFRFHQIRQRLHRIYSFPLYRNLTSQLEGCKRGDLLPVFILYRKDLLPNITLNLLLFPSNSKLLSKSTDIKKDSK